jgi:prophage regulatory protein
MRLLRLPAVIDKCDIKQTQIYRQMETGAFPLPIRIGERQVAWSEEELDQWIAARIAARHEHEPIRPATPRGEKRNPPNPSRKKKPGARSATLAMTTSGAGWVVGVGRQVTSSERTRRPVASGFRISLRISYRG